MPQPFAVQVPLVVVLLVVAFEIKRHEVEIWVVVRNKK